MYLYIDETIFMKDGKECYGVGALLTENKITNCIVDTALANLSADPDINDSKNKAQDYRTIERGFFHAADDSKNAHSHLCRCISSGINAIFTYSYFAPSYDKKSIEEKTDEQLHRLNTMLSMLHILEYEEPINIIIEGRMSFSQSIVNRFIKEFYNQIDLGVYETPFLIAVYPELRIEVSNKYEPGLQTTDFILWAVNNQFERNKSIWAKRLNLKFNSSFSENGGPVSGGDYILNSGISKDQKIKKINIYPDDIFPIDDSKYSNKDLACFYIQAEKILHDLSKQHLPNHVSHIKIDLKNLCDRLCKKDNEFTHSDLQNMASIFIRLFDTLPIYGGLSKEKDRDLFEKLIYTRRYLALTLHNELINGVRIANYLVRIRRKVMKEQPHLLGIAPD